MTAFQVEGMGCGSCVAKITTAIKALDFGADVVVDLETGVVSVQSNQSAEPLQEAIEDLGFDCVLIS